MTGFDATSYAFLSGTSMASAQVAGAAAFLFTKLPTATVAQIKDNSCGEPTGRPPFAGDAVRAPASTSTRLRPSRRAAVAGGVLTVHG